MMSLFLRPIFLLSSMPVLLAGLAIFLFVEKEAGADDSAQPAAEILEAAAPNRHICYEDDNLSIEVGIEGVVRLGKWVPITVAAKRDQVVNEILVETRDGQDKPVQYVCAPQVPNDAGLFQGLVRLGRYQAAIDVTINYSTGDSQKISVPISRLKTVASTKGVVLAIESGNKMATAIQSTANGDEDTSPVVKSVVGISRLPRSWLAYDAVDTVYLATGDDSILSRLSQEQVVALESWVREGGRLVLSAAPKNAEKWLSTDSLLNGFVPGQLSGVSRFANSSRLESFAESRNQLIKIGGEPIPTVALKDVQGRVWVGSENKQPLIVQHPVGFGDVVFVAFDLLSERIVEWESFPSVMQKIQEIKKRTDRDGGQSSAFLGGGLGQVGFSDLIGQLYTPLESFTQVGFVPFTAIAILISLYILCIGPLDYFLLQKLLGKMELTWITFPLFSLLFCGLAVGISIASRPASMQVNQLEIIDIDSITKQCRGSVWTNVYSASGRSLDVQVSSENGLGFSVDRSLASWHGQPGRGLGGMNTSSLTTLSIPSYRHSVDMNSVSSSLESFSIPVASSRALFSRWYSELGAGVRSTLKYREGSDQVYGTVKNPLDVQLINARLYHGEWAYILDDPLEPGEAFDVETNTKNRTLSSILNRKYRSSNDDKFLTSATRWEVSEKEVSRIAEVLMFYDAAGGKSYTGLSHNYQSFVDMSDSLMLGQAVLVGEIQTRASSLSFSESGEKVDDLEYDQVTTFVRIVLPVETVRSR